MTTGYCDSIDAACISNFDIGSTSEAFIPDYGLSIGTASTVSISDPIRSKW